MVTQSEAEEYAARFTDLRGPVRILDAEGRPLMIIGDVETEHGPMPGFELRDPETQEPQARLTTFRGLPDLELLGVTGKTTVRLRGAVTETEGGGVVLYDGFGRLRGSFDVNSEGGFLSLYRGHVREDEREVVELSSIRGYWWERYVVRPWWSLARWWRQQRECPTCRRYLRRGR